MWLLTDSIFITQHDVWKWSIWTGDEVQSFILWSHNRLTTLWNHQIMWIILIRLAFAFHWHPYRKDHSTGTLLFLGNKTSNYSLFLNCTYWKNGLDMVRVNVFECHSFSSCDHVWHEIYTRYTVWFIIRLAFAFLTHTFYILQPECMLKERGCIFVTKEGSKASKTTL